MLHIKSASAQNRVVRTVTITLNLIPYLVSLDICINDKFSSDHVRLFGMFNLRYSCQKGMSYKQHRSEVFNHECKSNYVLIIF